MTSNFVRYSPEIESIDPDIEEYMTRIIDFWEKTVRESPVREGTGHAVRGAHAKTLAVVRADVEILGDVSGPYAQGIYAEPGHHDAVIRFSSASNHLGPDAHLGPVLGLAIKIFDIEGTKLIDEEPDSTTFDLVLKNNPTFVANTAKHYVVLQEIGNDSGKYLARGREGFRELLTDLLTGKGTFEQKDWAWEEMFAYVKAAQTPIQNLVATDSPHRPVATRLAGLTGLVGQQPVAVLRVVEVGVEHGVGQVGLGQFPWPDWRGEPAVVGLARQLQDPARHRDGDPVDGQLTDERVHHFPGRLACDR